MQYMLVYLYEEAPSEVIESTLDGVGELAPQITI